MSRKLMTLLAAVMLVGLVMPAFSAVENVKVGGDILTYMILRNNFDMIKEHSDGNRDTNKSVMSSARIYVQAELSDQVTAMVRLINERDWGKAKVGANPYSEVNNMEQDRLGVHLDLAYLQIKDLLTPGLSATIGRQEIKFGEGFVVGNRYNDIYEALGQLHNYRVGAPDLTQQKAFEAIRMDYQAPAAPVKVTGFISKIRESYDWDFMPAPGNWYYRNNDTDLYGVNVGWQIAENALAEAYFVHRNYSEDADYRNKTYTFGLHGTHNVLAVPGLSWKAEIAKQIGKTTNADSLGGSWGYPEVDVDAWAGYIGAAYEFQVPAKPTILGQVTYFSGQSMSDTKQKGWCPIYPDDVGSRIGPIMRWILGLELPMDWPYFGYAYDQYPEYHGFFPSATDVLAYKAGFSVQPTEKISLGLNVWFDQLAKRASDSFTPKRLGTELQLTAAYKLTEDVTVGVEGGYLMLGKVLKYLVEDWAGYAGYKANPYQILGSVGVQF